MLAVIFSNDVMTMPGFSAPYQHFNTRHASNYYRRSIRFYGMPEDNRDTNIWRSTSYSGRSVLIYFGGIFTTLYFRCYCLRARQHFIEDRQDIIYYRQDAGDALLLLRTRRMP